MRYVSRVWSATWSVHECHVISACYVTWQVCDQPREHCMFSHVFSSLDINFPGKFYISWNAQILAAYCWQMGVPKWPTPLTVYGNILFPRMCLSSLCLPLTPTGTLSDFRLKSVWNDALWFFCAAPSSHSSILAWRIQWREEPGRLRSTGSQRVGNDWATSLSFFLFLPWCPWDSCRSSYVSIVHTPSWLRWTPRCVRLCRLLIYSPAGVHPFFLFFFYFQFFFSFFSFLIWLRRFPMLWNLKCLDKSKYILNSVTII